MLLQQNKKKTKKYILFRAGPIALISIYNNSANSVRIAITRLGYNHRIETFHDRTRERGVGSTLDRGLFSYLAVSSAVSCSCVPH